MLNIRAFSYIYSKLVQIFYIPDKVSFSLISVIYTMIIDLLMSPYISLSHGFVVFRVMLLDAYRVGNATCWWIISSNIMQCFLPEILFSLI